MVHYKFSFILLFICTLFSNRALALQLIKGPYVQYPTQATVTIMWETDQSSNSRVDYGDTTSYGQSTTSQEQKTVHEITLTGLLKEHVYHYKVTSGSTSSSDNTFQTAIADNSSFMFTVFGDTQDGTPTFNQIISRIETEKPNFIVGVGDITSWGEPAQFQSQLFVPAASAFKKTPFYAVLGNHDYYSGEPVPFYTYFSYPSPENYYSFTYGKTYCIILDSNKPYTPGSAQFVWLENKLASSAAQNADWLIVFFHHCPWTRYWDNGSEYSGEASVRSNLVPLFSKYTVDLVINGHSHCYQRGLYEKVNYIVTGGAGGSLDNNPTGTWSHITVSRLEYHYCKINISGGVLTLKAINLQGNMIDQFTIEKQISEVITNKSLNTTTENNMSIVYNHTARQYMFTLPKDAVGNDIHLFMPNGRRTITLSVNNKKQAYMNAADLNNGVFIAKATINGKVYSKTFIKSE